MPLASRRRHPVVRLLSPLRDFLHTEAAGGVLLVLAAIVALVWANSPWQASYERLWDSVASITVSGHTLSLDFRHWVNDAAMTIFFLVVGLEIKRELTSGHLASRRAAALPVAAAMGGMVVPALIYLAIAGGTDARGWGVPMATDIALAVGVLALLGRRVSAAMRAFLLGLAIVDDIGAILIIALVYSTGVSFGWLAAAVIGVLAVVVMRWVGIYRLLPYVAMGAVVWLALYEAGVHPTLAGVAMGLLAPSTPRLQPELIDAEELADISTPDQARTTSDLARSSVSVVEWLQNVLHPWTSYLIVPLFALANSGIEISSTSVRDAAGSAVAWGIFAGLVIGKPLGVVLAASASARTALAEMPSGTLRRQLVGVGASAGIGFTVAIFISELAFTDPSRQAEAKLAILIASLVSALFATAILMWRSPDPTSVAEQ
ncbi:MAG TPA: Na+/H+ antiporter NhaA [Ilumatobacteraceae bacterium]